jgi:LacI family transcriptional regulator
MSTRPQVALLIESSRGYGRGLLWGIARYAQAFGPWSLFCQDRGIGEPMPDWLRGWKGDGIILRAEGPAMERAIARRPIPAVNLRGIDGTRLPLIETDDRMVAQAAAEHLLERGFRQVGYCGFPGVAYSERRQAAFVERVGRAGCDCHLYVSRRRAPGGGQRQREEHGLKYEMELAHWVASLPKPIGLMACNDLRGQQLLNACREVAVAVPDEVAVVGVDNDQLICELSDPPLSSVEPDTRQIGYQAAALLDRMMQGERPPAAPLFVPPTSVVTRRSTDVLAIDDREVAQAVRFIREHACEGINVEDLLQEVPVTRVTLKRRFERLLGHSPKAEMVRVQLARVKQLLVETDFSLAQVAVLAGFKHAEYLSAVFKQKTGQTPGQYREVHQRLIDETRED